MTWNLPTLQEMAEARAGKPQLKGASRLEQQQADTRLTLVDEKAFLAAVRTRDKLRCRKCGRKVVIQLARAANRCEVHHLHGRRGDFRFDERFALICCHACHEQLTGKVNERWMARGTAWIDVPWKGGGVARCIDARHPVSFERIV